MSSAGACQCKGWVRIQPSVHCQESMSAAFNLPIERGFQNFREETTTVSVTSSIVGQGSCWLRATESEKEPKQREGWGGCLVPRGEGGFYGPWGNPCVSPEESSKVVAAVAGMTVSWCWIKCQCVEGKRSAWGLCPCWQWTKGTRKELSALPWQGRWVPCHGGEHSPHLSALPAAKMGPHLETSGLRTFHLPVTQAKHYNLRDSGAQWFLTCYWGYLSGWDPCGDGALVSMNSTWGRRLLWLSCFSVPGRDANTPPSNASLSTALYCTM